MENKNICKRIENVSSGSLGIKAQIGLCIVLINPFRLCIVVTVINPFEMIHKKITYKANVVFVLCMELP